MKRYVPVFFTIVFIAFVLWVSMPAQQIYKPQRSSTNVYAQQIDTLQLKIKRMEKELEEMRKVIGINGGNVEIKARGTLHLNGAALFVKSQGKLNLDAATMALKSSSQMTLKSSLIKLN